MNVEIRKPTDLERLQSCESREQTANRMTGQSQQVTANRDAAYIAHIESQERTIASMAITIFRMDSRLDECRELLNSMRHIAADSLLIMRVLNESPMISDEEMRLCEQAMSSVQARSEAVGLHVGETFSANEKYYRGATG